MNEEKNGVEAEEIIAPESQEVENSADNASNAQEGVDYKAELEAQLKKVSLERDN